MPGNRRAPGDPAPQWSRSLASLLEEKELAPMREIDIETWPLSAQGHHALMDGIHIAGFYARIQDYLYHPDYVFGSA
jgi:hypothetical protein